MKFCIYLPLRKNLRCGIWYRVLSDTNVPALETFKKDLLSGRVFIKLQDDDNVKENINNEGQVTTTTTTSGFEFDTTFRAIFCNKIRIFSLNSNTTSAKREALNQDRTPGFNPYLSVTIKFEEHRTDDCRLGDVFVFGGGVMELETAETALFHDNESESNADSDHGNLGESVISSEKLSVSHSFDSETEDEVIDSYAYNTIIADDIFDLLSELSRVTTSFTLGRASAALDFALAPLEPDHEIMQGVIDRVLVLIGWIKAENGSHSEESDRIYKGNMLLLLSELVTKPYFPKAGVEVILAFHDKNREEN